MPHHLIDSARDTRESRDFYNKTRSQFGEFVKAVMRPLTDDTMISLGLWDRDGNSLSLTQTNIAYSGSGPGETMAILVAEGFGDEATIRPIVQDRNPPWPIRLVKSSNGALTVMR